MDAFENFIARRLNSLPSDLVTLLKILLAVGVQSPNTNAIQPGSIFFVINDLFSLRDTNAMSTTEYARRDLECHRNKEITAKAISFILLMLVKQSRIFHACIYEHICHMLADANCILLILKILNQNVVSMLLREGDEVWCQFLEYTVRDPETMEMSANLSPTTAQAQASLGGDDEVVEGKVACRRNFYMIINMLRVLQKLVKDKPYRLAILMQYNAAGILKKVIKIEQPTLQTYMLKVYRCIVPLMGRKWRQSNMKVVTGIYMHLRPDLSSSWLKSYDSDIPVQASQEQDIALRSITNFWLTRKFPTLRAVLEDDDLFVGMGELGLTNAPARYDQTEEHVLDDVFMNNYERWLEDEVFGTESMDMFETSSVSVSPPPPRSARMSVPLSDHSVLTDLELLGGSSNRDQLLKPLHHAVGISAEDIMGDLREPLPEAITAIVDADDDLNDDLVKVDEVDQTGVHWNEISNEGV
jgi:hypothetical protein